MPLVLVALVVVITTARHEASHALAAWLTGVPIEEVRLHPGVDPDLGFYFGYVSLGDGGGWLVNAAPFISALLWCFAALVILHKMPGRSRFWFPVVLVGLVSPLADLAYNYQGGFWREGTDVSDLFRELPSAFVHAYFLGAMGICVACLRWARRARRAASRSPEPLTEEVNMALSAFDEKSKRPRPADLARTLGRASAHWLGLIAHAAAEYPPLEQTWTFAGAKWGWSLRLKQRKRTILYMTPCKGFFHAGFVLGEKAVELAHDAALPDSILEVIDGARKYAEGRGVRLEVRTRKDLDIVKKLAAVKMAS